MVIAGSINFFQILKLMLILIKILSGSANDRDRIAANKVLQSAHSGDRVTLSSHEAAHIRQGAQWLNANRDSFSHGFLRSASSLYENVYDKNGHKVVDGRMWRGV